MSIESKGFAMLSRAIAIGLLLLLGGGADWPRFRGTNGSGTSDGTGLPIKWSATENVAWKPRLPGHGSSSPIISGEKIFVTCHGGE